MAMNQPLLSMQHSLSLSCQLQALSSTSNKTTATVTPNNRPQNISEVFLNEFGNLDWYPTQEKNQVWAL